MATTRGPGAALPVAGLVLGFCLLAAGCDDSAPAPALRMRAGRPASEAAGAHQQYLAARVLQLRESPGTVTAVLKLTPAGGLGAFHVSHYGLSCALAQLSMTDGRGNEVRITNPSIAAGASGGSPGYILVPAEGTTLVVELLDRRGVVMATRVRGVVAPPPDGASLTYSLDAQIRGANSSLDRFYAVPIHGSGTLVYRRS